MPCKTQNTRFLLLVIVYCGVLCHAGDERKHVGNLRIMVLKSTFSLLLTDLGDAGPLMGSSSELGFVQNNKYYGIHFIFCHKNEPYRQEGEKGLFFGGGGISWHHRGLLNSKWLGFFPGYVIGFWSKNKWMFEGIEGQTEDDEFYETKQLFIGPKILFRIGYKYIFLTCDYTLFIGTGLANNIDVGLDIEF